MKSSVGDADLAETFHRAQLDNERELLLKGPLTEQLRGHKDPLIEQLQIFVAACDRRRI